MISVNHIQNFNMMSFFVWLLFLVPCIPTAFMMQLKLIQDMMQSSFVHQLKFIVEHYFFPYFSFICLFKYFAYLFYFVLFFFIYFLWLLSLKNSLKVLCANREDEVSAQQLLS